jgi:methionine-rich copper-binding protein CopC
MTIAPRRLSGVVATLALGWLVSCNVDNTELFRPEGHETPPPPAGSRLAFTAQPHDAAAGSVITPAVQVTVFDQLGNVVTSFIGDVTVALDANPTGAALAGTTTVPAVDGVATFADLSIDTPGTGYTLAASASAITGATSDPFDITAPSPGTGDLTVTTATTGDSPDPDGYIATLDGGPNRVFAINETFTLYGAAAGSHTVVLSDVAPNCSVSDGTSRPVEVPAGGSVSITFTVDCPTPAPQDGTLTVTTATSGPNQPIGYTVTIDGGQSRSLGLNASTTYTGLTAASHEVQLNGVPANCSVSEANPQTVTVSTGGTAQTATVSTGGTAQARFTITCTAVSGSLTVTTATSGPNQPSGYTVTVDGGQTRSLGLNATTTYTGLTAASHEVQLNGVPANCSVSEANPQTVTVSSGGTAQAATVSTGGTAQARFTITCTALSGSLTVTTATSGPNQPSGYTVTVDDGQSRSLGLNATTTYTGLTAAGHAVQLNGVPANCSVSEANPQTVTVSTGGTADARFTITCTAVTGSLVVSTSTSGGTPDPNGYTFTVDGGTPQAIANSQMITLTGVAAGSHMVQLGDIAGNCTVTGGTSRTVTVPAGGSATASFTVTCPTPSGSLVVSTSTSGGTPDPNGYTFTVDGGTPQAIANSQMITLTGVAAGSHMVQLGDIAGNCTVTGGTSRTVTVPAGGSVTASFSVSCPTPPPLNRPPSVNAGGNQTVVVVIGSILYTLNASFSDPDNDGPWPWTVDWGDGTSSSGTATSQGSISPMHSYLLGRFTITVTVTDSHSASGSDSKVLTVAVPL